MVIKNEGVHKNRLKTGKHMLLPLITMVIMLAIASIVTIAKGSVNSIKDSSIPVMTSSTLQFDEKGLNTSECNILRMLYQVMELSDNQLEQNENNGAIYFNNLKMHLNSPEVNIASEEENKVIDLIKDMNEVMLLEKIRDLKKMSIDGRKVVIYISKQIYERCGLNLVCSMEGDIIHIADHTGNNIYVQSNIVVTEITFYALAITLISMTILLCICIIIARKNKLFIKEVKYIGFDEKEFA